MMNLHTIHIQLKKRMYLAGFSKKTCIFVFEYDVYRIHKGLMVRQLSVCKLYVSSGIVILFNTRFCDHLVLYLFI